MFKAKNGDAFLIRCQDGGDSVNILVDAGPKGVYKSEIKPFLEELNKNGEAIDLLIVTHIDDDHIGGAIALIEDNGLSNNPNVISIKEVWHNAYRHLQNKYLNTPLNEDDREWLVDFSRKHNNLLSSNQFGKSTVSARQGSSLGALLLQGGYNWNTAVEGSAINTQTLPTYQIGNIACLKLLSPHEEQLTKLRNYWSKELRKQGFKGALTDDSEFDDAYEYFMRAVEEVRNIEGKQKVSFSNYNWETLKNEDEQDDPSCKNGSSIAFVLEFAGKRLLFAADAFPSVIADSIRQHYPDETTPCEMDAIKISHHGSKFNTSSDLLDMIDAPLYLISTNGHHSHPDLGTLVKIVDRSQNRLRTLMFNYETQSSKYFASLSKKVEQYKYQVVYKSIIEINKKGEYYE